MEFLKELVRFVLNRKKYWLIPVLLVLIIFGGLFVVSSGTAVAPFIYTIF